MYKRNSGYVKAGFQTISTYLLFSQGFFFGCVEHVNVIWHHIQTAEKKQSDINAVTKTLLIKSCGWPLTILVHPNITDLVKNYFRKVPFCLTGRELKPRLGSNLEFVIITGCSKVPLWLLSWQWRWTAFSLGSGRWGTQQWCASSANQNLHGQLHQHQNHIQHCYYPWQLTWRYSEPYITHWLGLATHMSSVRLYSNGANCHCQFPV